MESGEYGGEVGHLPAWVARLIEPVKHLPQTEPEKVLLEGRLAWLREFQARLVTELGGEF